LFECWVLRSPALIAAASAAGCHAVLASLSERYPPLEGRSPTRYSPVCHSTYPLRGFRVRLACVRHAASVDSEPGSNSHVKFVGPTAPCPVQLAPDATETDEHNSFNARPIGSCVVHSGAPWRFTPRHPRDPIRLCLVVRRQPSGPDCSS